MIDFVTFGTLNFLLVSAIKSIPTPEDYVDSVSPESSKFYLDLQTSVLFILFVTSSIYVSTGCLLLFSSTFLSIKMFLHI